MPKCLTMTYVATLVTSAAIPAHSQVSRRCPEGRTADGKCVNPDLSQDMRTGTVAFTQPKLSMTNPPVMPYQDGLYYVPRDHHEISNLHAFPPITSRTGGMTMTTINIGTITSPNYVTINTGTGPRP